MADIWNIISSNYVTVGGAVPSHSKYVAVDADKYVGSWKGKYANGKSFDVTISNVNGFRAKVKYQSGSTVKYQDVLIRDSAFRIGDSKFLLTGKDVNGKDSALIATIATNPVTGVSTMEKATATRN
ncbi:MAG: hypothetical protein BGP05_17320 [Rhizobiales bacterium 62-47]|jgi:hypothetical protein|nr:hypothetical protein [Hyphomicrobiales bacterium]OJY09560.1 MAG: hypothetical protein BGP05_17320 [Rhizobiales bacterium 62-47]